MNMPSRAEEKLNAAFERLTDFGISFACSLVSLGIAVFVCTISMGSSL